MFDITAYLPFLIAGLFFGLVVAFYVINKEDENKDLLRTRVQKVRHNSQSDSPVDSVRIFEQERERLMEVKLDDFFKDLAKKKGVSTGFIQKMTAGISAGAALITFGISVLISFCLFKVVFLLDTTDSALYSLPAGVMLTFMLFRKYQSRRETEFLSTFPLAFDVVSRGLKAGSSIEKTFITVSEQVVGPVAKEFERINQEIEFGVPFEEALVNAAERIQIDDFSFFTIALIIQKKAGGSLSDLVSSISTFLRKRQELRMKVKSLSAEAKATGIIVGSMPVLVLVAMYFVNPETIDILRFDPSGRKLSLFLVIFVMIGIWIMRKMTSIKV